MKFIPIAGHSTCQSGRQSLDIPILKFIPIQGRVGSKGGNAQQKPRHMPVRYPWVARAARTLGGSAPWVGPCVFALLGGSVCFCALCMPVGNAPNCRASRRRFEGGIFERTATALRHSGTIDLPWYRENPRRSLPFEVVHVRCHGPGPGTSEGKPDDRRPAYESRGRGALLGRGNAERTRRAPILKPLLGTFRPF